MPSRLCSEELGQLVEAEGVAWLTVSGRDM